MKKFLTAIIAASLCLAGTAFASGGGVHWGYSGEAGPANWGDLSPAFTSCKEGRSQSPIDLSGMTDGDLPPIKFAYDAVALDVFNNGHAIQANYEGDSHITVGGKTYKLLQFHFHSPSENTINGRSFPLEAHLVHKDADGNLAVVAVMFESGAGNSALKDIWSYMPAKAGTDRLVSHLSVNAADILPTGRDYFAFDGSLTTPPCSEGVKWMVLEQPVSLSREQLSKFRQTLGGPNNRPIQPLNGRVVRQ